MTNKSCFFIGSRYASDKIKDKLIEAIEQHITEYGVTTFTVGDYGWFDRMVQTVLEETKTRHPEIKLYLLTPYAFDKKTEAPIGFDGTLYPDGLETVPRPFAIIQANRLMVQRSDYLISYSSGFGNSQRITEYAQGREKKGLIKVTLLE